MGLPIAVVPPSETDLRRAVLVLERQLAPAEYKHIVYCVAKLITGFNERLTEQEAKNRARLWHETLPDLPPDLWSTATIELLQTWRRDAHFGRVPEAADVREIIGDRLAKRKRDLDRVRARLKAVPPKPVDPASVPLPRGLDRLRHTRATYERLGRTADVARIDRMIAGEREELGRLDAAAARGEDLSAPPPLSPVMQARTKLSLARSWRAQGNEKRAAALEAEAKELAPHLFEDQRDVPEAAQ